MKKKNQKKVVIKKQHSKSKPFKKSKKPRIKSLVAQNSTKMTLPSPKDQQSSTSTATFPLSTLIQAKTLSRQLVAPLSINLSCKCRYNPPSDLKSIIKYCKLIWRLSLSRNFMYPLCPSLELLTKLIRIKKICSIMSPFQN